MRSCPPVPCIPTHRPASGSRIASGPRSPHRAMSFVRARARHEARRRMYAMRLSRPQPTGVSTGISIRIRTPSPPPKPPRPPAPGGRIELRQAFLPRQGTTQRAAKLGRMTRIDAGTAAGTGSNERIPMRVRVIVADQSEARFYDISGVDEQLQPAGRIVDPDAHEEELGSERGARRNERDAFVA